MAWATFSVFPVLEEYSMRAFFVGYHPHLVDRFIGASIEALRFRSFLFGLLVAVLVVVVGVFAGSVKFSEFACFEGLYDGANVV
jgi:hypothetical protein